MYGNTGKKIFKTNNEAFAFGSTNGRCIVIYGKDVYDLTEFSSRHPGGRQTLLGYSGRVIDNILFNKNIHQHSQSALYQISRYIIGQVVIESGAVSTEGGGAKVQVISNPNRLSKLSQIDQKYEEIQMEGKKQKQEAQQKISSQREAA